MKRSMRLVAMLVILIALLGGYLVMRSINPELAIEEPPAEDSTVYEIVALDAGEVQSLRWDQGGESLTLERDEDARWVYAADQSFPLDQRIAEDLLAAAVAPVGYSHIEDPQELSEYGLDEPQLTVVLTLADDSQVFYEIGDQNGLTGDYYLSLNGGGEQLWTVPETLLSAFSYSLYDMIEMEEIPALGYAQAIRIDQASGALDLSYIEDAGDLTYTSDYHWFLRQGDTQTPLSTAKVEELIGKLSDLAWADCVTYHADEADLAAYGLLEPVVTVQLTYLQDVNVVSGETGEDGNATSELTQEQRTFTLLMGDYADSTYAYAKLPDSTMVYLIDATLVDAFVLASEASLRPDDVLPVDFDRVESMEIALNGQTYAITHEGTETVTDEEGNETIQSVYHMNGQKVDGATVESIQSRLSSLSTAEVAEGAQGRGEVIRFTLRLDDGNSVQLALHTYDSSYDLAEYQGEQRLLVWKSSVDSLCNLVETLTPLPETDESIEPES